MMRHLIWLLVSSFGLLLYTVSPASSSSIFIQQDSVLVKGRVLANDTKMGVPGANVWLKASKQGTMTGLKGEFALLLAKRDIDKKILIISTIGYRKKGI